MAFEVIIIVIELMFLGINMFLALLSAHFNTRYARAKMILSRAKTEHIYAHERQLYCYIILILCHLIYRAVQVIMFDKILLQKHI